MKLYIVILDSSIINHREQTIILIYLKYSNKNRKQSIIIQKHAHYDCFWFILIEND